MKSSLKRSNPIRAGVLYNATAAKGEGHSARVTGISSSSLRESGADTAAAERSKVGRAEAQAMAGKREYPDHPVVGVGGVVISGDRALLIRRGTEPLKGEWSIPGGTLEVGETLAEGVARELREETGLEVRVLDLIEAFERIFPDNATTDPPEPQTRAAQNLGLASKGQAGASAATHPAPTKPQKRPRYHFVILDYLCEAVAGVPRAGSDVTDIAAVREDELGRYRLTPAATRVLRKAFAMARARSGK